MRLRRPRSLAVKERARRQRPSCPCLAEKELRHVSKISHVRRRARGMRRHRPRRARLWAKKSFRHLEKFPTSVAAPGSARVVPAFGRKSASDTWINFPRPSARPGHAPAACPPLGEKELPTLGEISHVRRRARGMRPRRARKSASDTWRNFQLEKYQVVSLWVPWGVFCLRGGGGWGNWGVGGGRIDATWG